MSRILELLDQAKPELNPLAPHYIAKFESDKKKNYLTLLVAVLLEANNGQLNEPQIRLLTMLMTAMKAEIALGTLYEYAQQLDKESLIEIICQLRGNTEAESWFGDVCLLLALSNKQEDSSNVLLSEIIQQLSVCFSEIDFFIKYLLGKEVFYHSKTIYLIDGSNIIRNTNRITIKEDSLLSSSLQFSDDNSDCNLNTYLYGYPGDKHISFKTELIRNKKIIKFFNFSGRVYGNSYQKHFDYDKYVLLRISSEANFIRNSKELSLNEMELLPIPESLCVWYHLAADIKVLSNGKFDF